MFIKLFDWDVRDWGLKATAEQMIMEIFTDVVPLKE